MAKIKLNGSLVDEIYVGAINSLPYGGAAVANVIATNPKNQPCPPKKVFDKTCKFMQHNLKPEEQSDTLYAAARNLLINKYGYPPAVLDCYRLQVKNNELVLKSEGKLKSLLKNLPNMARDLTKNDGQTVSDISRIKESRDDVMARLAQHQQWLRERDILLDKAKEMFGMDEAKQREFAASIPDHRANLSGLDIRDMDLSAYDLNGVICKGAKIENCVLGSISGMDLSGSQIFNSKFVGPDMSCARFNDTQMDHVTVQNYAKMTDADFTGSDQYSVNYMNCNFEGAILSDQMVKDLQDRPNAQKTNVPQAAPLPEQEQNKNQIQNDSRPTMYQDKIEGYITMSM